MICKFQVLPESQLQPETICGISFTTFTIDSPRYLNYLLARFLAVGGTIVRGSISHIDQIVEGGGTMFTSKRPSPPHAIVVCAGLGARSLGGVEDKDMYPLRGQTILVRAPWVRFGRTISTKGGLWTYIIPRRSGDVRHRLPNNSLSLTQSSQVIVGGTKIANDWFVPM